MTKDAILRLVAEKIRVRHYSLRTEEAYCHWVGRFCDFSRALKTDLSSELRVELFLTDLAVRQQVAARTQNQALAALLFLYEHALGKPLGKVDALRAKRPERVREAPSRDEVRALFDELKDTPLVPARLLAQMLYGCGLRVQEPLELRIKDVRIAEGIIIIRGAKGAKDRVVAIPCALMHPLRDQVERARAVWQWDRKQRVQVGVSLPSQLAKKYPSAPYAWGWFWLFPSGNYCEHPRQPGLTVRWRLHEASLQRAVAEARQRAGIATPITPHVLRHGYATHSSEDPRTIQRVMGHANLETTMGYIHREVAQARSPLDDIMTGGESASALPLRPSWVSGAGVGLTVSL